MTPLLVGMAVAFAVSTVLMLLEAGRYRRARRRLDDIFERMTIGIDRILDEVATDLRAKAQALQQQKEQTDGNEPPESDPGMAVVSRDD